MLSFQDGELCLLGCYFGRDSRGDQKNSTDTNVTSMLITLICERLPYTFGQHRPLGYSRREPWNTLKQSALCPLGFMSCSGGVPVAVVQMHDDPSPHFFLFLDLSLSYSPFSLSPFSFFFSLHFLSLSHTHTYTHGAVTVCSSKSGRPHDQNRQ